MPRVAKKKKPATPEWKRMNMRARLEQQLAGVVEDVGDLASRKSQVALSEPATYNLQPANAPIFSSHREYDHRLIAHVTQGQPGRSRKLTVRVGDHDASPHVVSVGGLARKFDISVREPELENVDAWEAPYETPPSIETFASLASDLYVYRVMPALWLEQFTPGDSEIAYRESYGLVSRLRAPFIRWEPTRPVASRKLQVAKPEEHQQIFEEQFTPIKESTLSRWKWAVIEAFAKAKDREEELITETEQSWGVPVLVPRLSPPRVMVGFFGLLLLVSLPAGAVSLSRSVGASWIEATQSGNTALASADEAIARGTEADSWQRVSTNLQETDQALNRVNALAVALSEALPQTRDAYVSARNLLHAGDNAAQAATLLSQGLERAMGEPVPYPIERLRIFKTYLEAAAPLLDDASESMAAVKPEVLPVAQRAKAEEATSLMTAVRGGIRELRTIADLLMAVGGDEHQRSYLLIFQNSTELRPTGGFMGSIAQVTLDRGVFTSIVVPGGGPYDLRDQLKTRALPPEPLQLVATRWEFQDINWFPDFPSAAKLIRRYWSEAGQPSVDGVVAVNLRVMQRLLEITGPVDMPEYGKTITAENFWLETQKTVELEYDKTENKPKKFIGDLMPKMIERLKNLTQEQQIKLLALVGDSLETKDVQMWLAKDDEEALVERFGWSGRFKTVPGDALAVIDTNIAGQKSDMLIDERVQQAVEIAEDGSITDTVTISRHHTGTKGEIFTGVNNVTYLRVYVPEGSELLAADGFMPPEKKFFKAVLASDAPDPDVAATETNPRQGPNGVRITDEFGRTAFGGWVQLEPGESSTTTFRYRLPFTAFDVADRMRPEDVPASSGAPRPAYMSLYTSQSGKPERRLETVVHAPADWTAVWQSGGLSADWDRDRVNAALFVTGN